MYFCIPWGILANVKISRLSTFSSWLCDLFPLCIALRLHSQAPHEGNKSRKPSLQADNPYLTDTLLIKNRHLELVPASTLLLLAESL